MTYKSMSSHAHAHLSISYTYRSDVYDCVGVFEVGASTIFWQSFRVLAVSLLASCGWL